MLRPVGLRPGARARATSSSPSRAWSPTRRSWRRSRRCSTCCGRRLGTPVDIEFASDGDDLYLLQCRAQSYRRGRRAGADSPRPPARPGRVLGEPLRLQRPRPGHHPHRLRRSGSLRGARRPQGPEGGRPRGGPAQQAAAEAPVHPDGARPLGQPRRHQARRQRDLLRHQQHRGPGRDRAQEGQLRPRPLLRHALLPGPRRGGDPLPAALSRRRGNALRRGLPHALAQHPRPSCFPSCRASAGSCGSSTCPG